MQDKLNILLDKIKLPLEERKYFEEGVLEKIVCNKAKDTYIFLLSLKKVLPLDVFLKLQKLIKPAFKLASINDSNKGAFVLYSFI